MIGECLLSSVTTVETYLFSAITVSPNMGLVLLYQSWVYEEHNRNAIINWALSAQTHTRKTCLVFVLAHVIMFLHIIYRHYGKLLTSTCDKVLMEPVDTLRERASDK